MDAAAGPVVTTAAPSLQAAGGARAWKVGQPQKESASGRKRRLADAVGYSTASSQRNTVPNKRLQTQQGVSLSLTDTPPSPVSKQQQEQQQGKVTTSWGALSLQQQRRRRLLGQHAPPVQASSKPQLATRRLHGHVAANGAQSAEYRHSGGHDMPCTPTKQTQLLQHQQPAQLQQDQLSLLSSPVAVKPSEHMPQAHVQDTLQQVFPTAASPCAVKLVAAPTAESSCPEGSIPASPGLTQALVHLLEKQLLNTDGQPVAAGSCVCTSPTGGMHHATLSSPQSSPQPTVTIAELSAAAATDLQADEQQQDSTPAAAQAAGTQEQNRSLHTPGDLNIEEQTAALPTVTAATGVADNWPSAQGTQLDAEAPTPSVDQQVVAGVLGQLPALHNAQPAVTCVIDLTGGGSELTRVSKQPRGRVPQPATAAATASTDTACTQTQPVQNKSCSGRDAMQTAQAPQDRDQQHSSSPTKAAVLVNIAGLATNGVSQTGTQEARLEDMALQPAPSPAACRSPWGLPAVGTWGPRRTPYTASGTKTSGLTHLLRAAQLATPPPGILPSPASSLVTPSSVASSPRTSPFKCSPLRLFDLPLDAADADNAAPSPAKLEDDAAAADQLAQQSTRAHSSKPTSPVLDEPQDAHGAGEALDGEFTAAKAELQAASTPDVATAAAAVTSDVKPSTCEQLEAQLENASARGVEVAAMASCDSHIHHECVARCVVSQAAAEEQHVQGFSGSLVAKQDRPQPAMPSHSDNDAVVEEQITKATESLAGADQAQSSNDAEIAAVELCGGALPQGDAQLVGNCMQLVGSDTQHMRDGAVEEDGGKQVTDDSTQDEDCEDACLSNISRLVASFSPAHLPAPHGDERTTIEDDQHAADGNQHTAADHPEDLDDQSELMAADGRAVPDAQVAAEISGAAASPVAAPAVDVAGTEHAGACQAAYDGALYSTPTSSRLGPALAVPLISEASPTMHHTAQITRQAVPMPLPVQQFCARPLPCTALGSAVAATSGQESAQHAVQEVQEHSNHILFVNALWEASPAGIPASLSGLLDDADASLMDWAGLDVGRRSSPAPMEWCEVGIANATAGIADIAAIAGHENIHAGRAGTSCCVGEVHVAAVPAGNDQLLSAAVLPSTSCISMLETAVCAAAAAVPREAAVTVMQVPAKQPQQGVSELALSMGTSMGAQHMAAQDSGPLPSPPAAATISAPMPAGHTGLMNSASKTTSSGHNSVPVGLPRPPGAVAGLFQETPPSAGAYANRRRRGAMMLAAANSQHQAQQRGVVAGSPAGITTPCRPGRATPVAPPDSASQESAPSGISPGTPSGECSSSRMIGGSSMMPRMLANMTLLSSTPPVPARTRHGTPHPHPHAAPHARTLTPPSPITSGPLLSESPRHKHVPAAADNTNHMKGAAGVCLQPGKIQSVYVPYSQSMSPTQDYQVQHHSAAPVGDMPVTQAAYHTVDNGSQLMAVGSMPQGATDAVLEPGLGSHRQTGAPQVHSMPTPTPAGQLLAYAVVAAPAALGQQGCSSPKAGLPSPGSHTSLLSPTSLGRHTARKRQLACRRVLLSGDEQLPDFAAEVEHGNRIQTLQPEADRSSCAAATTASADERVSGRGTGAQHRSRPHRSIIPVPNDSEDEQEDNDDDMTESDEELLPYGHQTCNGSNANLTAVAARGSMSGASARARAAAGSPAGAHQSRYMANGAPAGRTTSGRLAGLAGSSLASGTVGLSNRQKRFGFASPLPCNSARTKPSVMRTGGVPTRRTVLGGRGSGLQADEDEGTADESHVLHVPRTTSAQKSALVLQGRAAPAAPWAPTCPLEQRAREAHHNCCLAQAWYDSAARWARMDMSGQEVSLHSLEAYKASTSQCMAEYKDRYGPELASLLQIRLQAEWQQLETVRRAAYSRATLPGEASTAATTPSPTPAVSPEPLAGVTMPWPDNAPQSLLHEPLAGTKLSSNSESPGAVIASPQQGQPAGMDWVPDSQPMVQLCGKENTPPAGAAAGPITSSSPDVDNIDDCVAPAALQATKELAGIPEGINSAGNAVSIAQLLDGTPVSAKHTRSASAPGSAGAQRSTPVSILKQSSRAAGRPAKCVQFASRLELGQNTGYR